MNNAFPRTATPRLFDPQHAFWSGGVLYRYIQNGRPVFASSASTSFGRWVTYIIPSTTSGVDCHAPSTFPWNTHFCSRFATLPGVICRSGLCRLPEYPPEYVNQF